jgi:Tfp pilus assembly protein PilV
MRCKNIGFSLTETLLAVATLAIGLMFVAGTFVAGVHFSTIATERTIAAVAADEAFAKIRLYSTGIDPNLAVDKMTRFEELVKKIDPNEFAYPSTENKIIQKQYYWSALCRLVAPNSRLVQLTVFISRTAGEAASYRGGINHPIPLQVNISGTAGNNQLKIEEPTDPAKKSWINDGYHIVNDKTGQTYRVVERDADQPDTVVLDNPWQSTGSGSVWVVPPPTGSGRNLCVAIYQKVVRF